MLLFMSLMVCSTFGRQEWESMDVMGKMARTLVPENLVLVNIQFFLYNCLLPTIASSAGSKYLENVFVQHLAITCKNCVFLRSFLV